MRNQVEPINLSKGRQYQLMKENISALKNQKEVEIEREEWKKIFEETVTFADLCYD